MVKNPDFSAKSLENHPLDVGRLRFPLFPPINKGTFRGCLFLFFIGGNNGRGPAHAPMRAILVLPLAVNMFYLFCLVQIVLDGARLARYRKRYAAFRHRRNIDALRQNPVVHPSCHPERRATPVAEPEGRCAASGSTRGYR